MLLREDDNSCGVTHTHTRASLKSRCLHQHEPRASCSASSALAVPNGDEQTQCVRCQWPPREKQQQQPGPDARTPRAFPDQPLFRRERARAGSRRHPPSKKKKNGRTGRGRRQILIPLSTQFLLRRWSQGPQPPAVEHRRAAVKRTRERAR